MVPTPDPATPLSIVFPPPLLVPAALLPLVPALVVALLAPFALPLPFTADAAAGFWAGSKASKSDPSALRGAVRLIPRSIPA